MSNLSLSYVEPTSWAKQKANPLLIKGSTVRTAVLIKYIYIFVFSCASYKGLYDICTKMTLPHVSCIQQGTKNLIQHRTCNRPEQSISYIILSFSQAAALSNVWEICLQPFLLVISDVLILATKLVMRPPWKDLLLRRSPSFRLACFWYSLSFRIENCLGFLWARQWSKVPTPAPSHTQCSLLLW